MEGKASIELRRETWTDSSPELTDVSIVSDEDLAVGLSPCSCVCGQGRFLTMAHPALGSRVESYFEMMESKEIPMTAALE